MAKNKKPYTNREVLLEAQDVHTYYGDSYVLQGLSLDVCGGIVALLGRNGVGKTTLMQSIMGLVPPRRGKIIFKGTDVTSLLPEKIARLGISIVPQGRRIFPSLTVYENLAVAARKRPGQNWNIERIIEIFPILKERSSQLAGKLSGGEQQMLSICRSLRTNSDLILMDEPTEGLAPLLLEIIKKVLQKVRKEGLCIFLAEQNIGFALSLADYVYVMMNGKIVYDSVPEELQKNDEAKQLYLGV